MGVASKILLEQLRPTNTNLQSLISCFEVEAAFHFQAVIDINLAKWFSSGWISHISWLVCIRRLIVSGRNFGQTQLRRKSFHGINTTIMTRLSDTVIGTWRQVTLSPSWYSDKPWPTARFQAQPCLFVWDTWTHIEMRKRLSFLFLFLPDSFTNLGSLVCCHQVGSRRNLGEFCFPWHF